MKKPFNLSEWAINNRSVVVYLMVISVVAGVAAFYKLGFIGVLYHWAGEPKTVVDW